jgi:N-sulfoglucosamine sulfohydrolase
MMNNKIKKLITGIVGVSMCAMAHAATEKPNILWITCEDISPHLGSYGDSYAITPTLDTMAAQGVRYTQACATAGVCAPARSALVSGIYATSLGSQNMRSSVQFPSILKTFPQILREAGYYCSNHVKQDYNFKAPGAWSASSGKAHWRQREAGQPFFSVFNIKVSHEGHNFSRNDSVPKVHDPAAINNLPPYYPDTPLVREEWALYYDNTTAMDKEVARILRELEDDGLSDNTIVFFFSDHGMGLPRGKFWLYDSSIRVPLIIHFPAKYRHLAPSAPGTVSDRVVSFVDFGPTVLSLAGVAVPEYTQGLAFLGEHATEPRDYAFAGRDRLAACDDLVRAVHDKRYNYIRNFKPFIPSNPGSQWWYDYHHAIRLELKRLKAAGQLTPAQLLASTDAPRVPEELYDLQEDPYELHNLANSPQHREIMIRMRAALAEWMVRTRDLGLLPEFERSMRSAGSSPYEMARKLDAYPLARLMETADLMAQGKAALPELKARLADQDCAVRYWALMGLMQLGESARPAVGLMTQALKDESADVRLAASQALCRLGRFDDAVAELLQLLHHKDGLVRMRAVGIFYNAGDKAFPFLPDMKPAWSDKALFGYARLCMKGMIGVMEQAAENQQPIKTLKE